MHVRGRSIVVIVALVLGMFASISSANAASTYDNYYVSVDHLSLTNVGCQNPSSEDVSDRWLQHVLGSSWGSSFAKAQSSGTGSWGVSLLPRYENYANAVIVYWSEAAKMKASWTSVPGHITTDTPDHSVILQLGGPASSCSVSVTDYGSQYPPTGYISSNQGDVVNYFFNGDPNYPTGEYAGPPIRSGPARGGECGDTVTLVAMGSGQSYTSGNDLSHSPQLKYLIDSARTTLGSKKLGVRVIDYPAPKIEVLWAGLSDIHAQNRVDLVNQAYAKLTTNTESYLAGKTQGLSAMWGQFTSVRSECPSSTKIVLAGYSQGAMVVHEFLNQLAASNDAGARGAVIGAALIADPERVWRSAPLEFSDASPYSFGICALLDSQVHCPAPDVLADVSRSFASKTVSVCSYFDPVCDTTQMTDSLVAGLVNKFAFANSSAFDAAVNQASLTHDSYKYMPETKTAGKWLGRKMASS